MEELKNHPSLPSNYVSLVQLRERWLNEQLRNEREKQQNQTKHREKEDHEPKSKEPQENPKHNQNGERTISNSVSDTRRQFRAHLRTIDVSKPESEDSQSEAVVVHDEQKMDELKKKKKKWRKNRKPRVLENLTGGTAQFSPDNEPEETIPVVVSERNGEKEEMRTESRRNGLNWKVRELKVPVNWTVEIKHKFEKLSFNGGKEHNVKSKAEMDVGFKRYNRGFGKLDERRPWKQKDRNLVWVKKGEMSDTDAGGVRSSGTL